MPPASEWKALIEAAVQNLRRGDLEKVVLARESRVRGAIPCDAARVIRRLRADYPNCFVYAMARGERCFLGASPEQLVRLREGRVWASCLAGSIARGATDAEDHRLGEALVASAKNRVEHDVVVRAIRESLAPVCVELSVEDVPTLLKVHNVQHLITPVTGRVAHGRGILDLVERLHPTPAVGGWPRALALDWIREREGLDRGWYAGPIGWLDRCSEGEFAVAIRSALLITDDEPNNPRGVPPRLREASLFAGCGIVADSDPDSEYAESRLKLQPMRAALYEGAIDASNGAPGNLPPVTRPNDG